MAQTQEFIATGRRKTSVARIRMTPGSGKIDINGRSFEDYFPTGPLQNAVLQPLQAAKMVNTYDLSINTTGGGMAGQAGAARLAISRALLQADANLRATRASGSNFRNANFVSSDTRRLPRAGWNGRSHNVYLPEKRRLQKNSRQDPALRCYRRHTLAVALINH